MTRHVYVHQWGVSWYSFTRKQWLEWVPKAIEDIQSGEGYELPRERELTRRPKGLARIEYEWYSSDPQVKVIHRMVDWTAKDFEDHLADLLAEVPATRTRRRRILTEDEKKDIRHLYYHGKPKPATVSNLTHMYKVSRATIYKVLKS